MVAERDGIGTSVEEFVVDRLGDAEAAGRVLAIDDDEVQLPVLDEAGQWGIREPVAEAPEVHPDILIVPLAAFDRHGHRIGFGAGYYDMTIAALRAKKQVTAVGIAFAAQEIARVPATERDARLDFMLTECEVIDFSKV
jgi:5-formyltetrahydrofolate cyclo-ligase